MTAIERLAISLAAVQVKSHVRRVNGKLVRVRSHPRVARALGATLKGIGRPTSPTQPFRVTEPLTGRMLDVQVTHEVWPKGATGDDIAEHTLLAEVDTGTHMRMVGKLSFSRFRFRPNKPWVWTVDAATASPKRVGIGTQLWLRAQLIQPELQHSDVISSEAIAWDKAMEAMGIYSPNTEGRYTRT